MKKLWKVAFGFDVIHSQKEVPNHLEEFQELVKSLKVNPMELGGVKD